MKRKGQIVQEENKEDGKEKEKLHNKERKKSEIRN